MTSAVYLIDDDDAVQFLLTIGFSDIGYNLLTFKETSEFEQFFSKNPEKLKDSILLVDINLPKEDGDVFVNRLADVLSTISGLQIVFLTENPESINPSELLLDRVQYSAKNDVVDWVQHH